MAYTQNFVALDGTTFTLNIGGVTPATPPKLSSEPMETQEDADTDMFMPVRTQSGYVRMVAEDNTTWRQFIPSSAIAMPVKLYQGSTIRWQGYVQTGTYGTTYPAIYNEFELPLICGLSALDSFDVEVTGPADMVTLGQLLYYIFSKLTGLSYTFYFHASSSTDNDIRTWLGYKLSWRNFLTENGVELTSRFTCLGLLQELCKFFGWTCRTSGDGVYFTAITDGLRNQRWLSCPLAQLQAASPVFTPVTMKSLALTDAMFASTDHSEEYIPGVKKVTVSPELNPYDVIMEIPYDDICRPYKYDNPQSGVVRWKNDPLHSTEVWLLHRGAINYENAQVKITSFVETDEQSTTTGSMCYGRFIAFDDNTEDDKSKFSWTKCYECFISNDYGARRSSVPLFSIESKGAVILGDGVLYISGRADSDEWGTIEFAECTLRIGDLFWDGDNKVWTSTFKTCEILQKKNGIYNSDTVYNQAEYDGWGIPITTPMTGKIYFAIHKVEPLPLPILSPNGYFPLMDFKIGFVRNGEEDDLNDKEYTANGGSFPEDVNVDTIFSSDKTNTVNAKTFRCQAGYGLVYSGNIVANTIPFGTTQLKPEQHVADLIAAYGSTIRRSLQIDLWTNLTNSLGPDYKVSLESADFYPISISHRWRDNITTLKIMQL